VTKFYESFGDSRTNKEKEIKKVKKKAKMASLGYLNQKITEWNLRSHAFSFFFDFSQIKL
jgi:hypothetical protein